MDLRSQVQFWEHGTEKVDFLTDRDLPKLLDKLSDDELIDRFRWKSLHAKGMIEVDELAARPNVPLSGTVEPFSKMPAEIMDQLLKLLDIRSLLRFTEACHGAQALVESLPAYTELRDHASVVLVALSKTKLIAKHPIGLLHSGLRDPRCFCCQTLGPFIFLPTCQRVCFRCLQCCNKTRLASFFTAISTFGLPPNHYDRLNILHTIPGIYGVGRKSEHTDSYKLVSISQAFSVASSAHGSSKAALDILRNLDREDKIAYLFYDEPWPIKRMIDALLLSLKLLPCQDRATKPHKWPEGLFNGMGATTFPFLAPDGAVERGYWCLGCKGYFETEKEVLGLDDPWMASPRDKLCWEINRARLKKGFLGHVRVCRGVRLLVEAEENDIGCQ